MSKTAIIHCSEENMQVFSKIMYLGFIDKYPKFFYGLEENAAIELITKLNLAENQTQNETTKFLIKQGTEYPGAMSIYTSKKNFSFKSTFKILRNYFGFFKSIATSFMLSGFGPPRNFPKNTLFIEKVATSEKHRRKGFGKRLLDYSIEHAKNSKLKYIELEVISNNQGAIALYEHYGFKIVKTTRTLLGEAFLGVKKYHLMRKEL